MATFYKCMNNGTIAIVPEETYEKIQAWVDLADETKASQLYPRPIFTFEREEMYTKYFRDFMTGDLTLMDELLKGHVVTSVGFYVPFSNHFELQNGEQGVSERKFRTTLAEAVETFGLAQIS